MEITIYQPINPTFRVDNNKKVYDKSEYHKVYEYTSGIVEDSVEDFLETVFMVFNRGDKPEGYEGHSLSVGDIVEVENVAYVCANCGWNKVEWKES